MPWFYYSGTVPRSIPVKKGLSVAIRPHSRVEIFEAQSREVQSLIKKGQLRRTGKPVGASSTDGAETVSGEEIRNVTPRSELSKNFAEKGVTTEPSKPPKKAKGAPEMTSAEVDIADKSKVSDSVEELSVETKEESKKKTKKRDA